MKDRPVKSGDHGRRRECDAGQRASMKGRPIKSGDLWLKMAKLYWSPSPR
jgi:hypothetical protein